MNRITIRRPDDFHVHFRRGLLLEQVVGFTARVFGRALVMPNTTLNILTAEDAADYEAEIRAATAGTGFAPLMTIRLVPETTTDMIRAAAKAGVVVGKLYVGITTGSDAGVSDVRTFAEVFAEMERCGMVLSLHGEVPSAFCLDREAAFLPELAWVAETFPTFRIVLEHVTTDDAVRAVMDLPETVAATITAHHLRLTLDDVLGNKLRPHNYCMPIAKRPEDRAALQRAAVSGTPKFFFGSDTAPHRQEDKECAEGCAGCFTAPVALPLLIQVFEELGALERLEPFVSEFGARFYGLPPNEGTITLVREPWAVPSRYYDTHGVLPVPWLAGQFLDWQIKS